MTFNTGQKNRSFHLTLPDALSDSEKQSLQDNMNKLDAVQELQIQNSTLTIYYQFPALCLSQLWKIIITIIDTDRFSFISKLKITLRCYIEDNEYGYLQQPYGWDRYTQAIYVEDHKQHKINADVRKQQWQHYNKKLKK